MPMTRKLLLGMLRLLLEDVVYLNYFLDWPATSALFSSHTILALAAEDGNLTEEVWITFDICYTL